MKIGTSFKLVFVFAIFAVLLTACFDSKDSMEGMDHSNMNQSGMTNTDSSNQSNVNTQDKTSKMTTLKGKEFTLTAKTSNLEITPGKTLPVWTFNNSVPGPEFRVKQGDTVKITLKNDLPEPTTIHWHGLPVPNEMDGIPGVTQNAVQPGKSFVYEFKATVPGTYWYHSHQDGANQVDKGLYGAFIVEGTDEKVDRDYTLVLDEWMSMGDMDMSSMDNSSMNMDMSSMDHSNMNMDSSKDQASSENNIDHGNMSDDAHGSSAEGHDMSMYDIYSINGKSGDSIDKLIVKKGEKVRIRLVNAGLLSHNIHLHGHEFKVVSTDGQPINNPASINDQVISIAPGERYDLEFEANNPGQWYIEDHGDDPRVKGMKAIIAYEGANADTDKPNETAALPILDLTRYGQSSNSVFTLDQKYDLEYTMDLNTDQQSGQQVYTINGKTYPDTEKIKVKKGDLVKVRLVNNSKTDDHPMHLHGHFFQVLSKNGKPIEGSPIVKDTLNLKPGEEYEVAFVADNPGDWMFHCHELHHAAAGMVTHLRYTDYKSDFVPDPNAGNKPE
ncbi:multicopper oxidase family protein [Marinicrinis lubricantis]|uniref:Multicopper oxidase family protein n=1 Tax=Marinicrinis lubricantis TaxID=2086470 RepID=A0ABW1ITZ5_9BACL